MTGRHAWTSVPATERSDAIVAAMALGGIEHVFFTSGSEIAFFQEAIAKAQAHGRPAPRLVTMLHEHAGLNAALGYAAVSGKTAATAVHVDAGTLNHGAAIHTASRADLPVLMLAGAPPVAPAGSMRGARDRGGHIWYQQTFDQNAIVRQYVKWDHRLEYQDNAGLLVSRALQVARSQPCGPVYLSIPREIALLPADGATFPTAGQLGFTIPSAPDADAIAEIAERLVTASRPVVVVSGSGKTPAAERLLVEICELIGARVVVPAPHGTHSFPMGHSLFHGYAGCAGADAVLVLACKVPWLPGTDAPPDDAFVAVIDVDPIYPEIPTLEFTADARVASAPEPALRALLAAIPSRLDAPRRAAIAERKRAAVAEGDARRAAADATALARAGRTPIDPLFLSYQIGRMLDERCVIFDDTLAHNHLLDYMRSDQPGSYYNNAGTSGGWAPGAAFGAKLADPSRDMIAVTGDGFYMFATANAAIWSAVRERAPFLTIVYQNDSYTTGTVSVKRTYVDGYAEKAGFLGGYLDPPIDLAAEARSAGAYAENVTEPGDLAAALKRGLDAVRAGTPAVVCVRLPRLLEER